MNRRGFLGSVAALLGARALPTGAVEAVAAVPVARPPTTPAPDPPKIRTFIPGPASRPPAGEFLFDTCDDEAWFARADEPLGSYLEGMLARGEIREVTRP